MTNSLRLLEDYSSLFATVRTVRTIRYSRLFAIRYSGFPDTLKLVPELNAFSIKGFLRTHPEFYGVNIRMNRRRMLRNSRQRCINQCAVYRTHKYLWTEGSRKSKCVSLCWNRQIRRVFEYLCGRSWKCNIRLTYNLTLQPKPLPEQFWFRFLDDPEFSCSSNHV